MASRELDVRRPRPPGRRPMPGPGVVQPPAPHERRGPFESWAGLDPTGFAPYLVRAARLVPGVVALEQQVIVPLERRVLELAVARARDVLAPPPNEPVRRPRPQQVLTDLIDEAIDQTPTTGRDELHVAMLERLVPDEVRILAVLADASALAYPVVHVTTRRHDDTPVLRNASSVGRAAEVVLPERTPLYVGDLIQLGLAELGPADPALRDAYERLLAEPRVRSAIAEASHARRFGRARVERRTLRITDFGRELWEANRPSRR